MKVTMESMELYATNEMTKDIMDYDYAAKDRRNGQRLDVYAFAVGAARYS